MSHHNEISEHGRQGEEFESLLRVKIACTYKRRQLY